MSTFLTFALAGFIGSLVHGWFSRRELAAREAQHLRVMDELRQLHTNALIQQLERYEQRHAAEIERIHQAYHTASSLASATVGTILSASQYGGPKGEAEVEQTPDAEIEIRKRVHEDTVQVGIQRLRAAYEANGITSLTDAELREEAEMMLNGQSPHSTVAVPTVRD